MQKFFVTYGCYIDMSHEVVETYQTLEQCSKETYYRAMKATEDWHGTHGFGTEQDEFEGTDAEYTELVCEECEEAAEYTTVVYVPEEHDMYL